MLFNSEQYLVFFLAVLIVSWALAKRINARNWFILLSSFYFYFSNNGWLILLLFICMQIDYFAALLIERSQSLVRKRLCLAVSMTANLCMLGFFKYFNFFCSSASSLLSLAGVQSSWQTWNILLPVGISFYTFESMSYTIDVYRGLIPAEKSWHRFALFVAYFPHLIAGPILRPRQFLPQLTATPSLNRDQFETAIYTIVRGLVKKVVLADYLATYASLAFDKPLEVGCLAAWLGVFAFTFQIYYDFSGYTDIAIGCARLMGLEIPENFNRPYASASITEFWKRWHISLSSWLRDYLYIPLGGNRMPNRIGIYRNLMITMLLGGLWHGAAWHFVIWGGLQGALLVLERIMGVARASTEPGSFSISRLGRQASTLLVLTFGWMIFRARSLPLFGQLIHAMFGFSHVGIVTNGMVAAVGIIIIGWSAQLIREHFNFEELWLKTFVPVKGLAYAALALAVVVCNSEGAKPFIYFQF